MFDSQREAAIKAAEIEWRSQGVLTLITVNELTELGVDVYSLEQQWEQEQL